MRGRRHYPLPDRNRKWLSHCLQSATRDTYSTRQLSRVTPIFVRRMPARSLSEITLWSSFMTPWSYFVLIKKEAAEAGGVA